MKRYTGLLDVELDEDSPDAFYVAVDAVKLASVLGGFELRHLLKMGFTESLICEVVAYLQMSDEEKVAESDHDALASFPRGRYRDDKGQCRIHYDRATVLACPICNKRSST